MAKTTRANGPTFSDHEKSDPNPPIAIRRAMLGGEPELVGTPFSESSESEQSSSEQMKENPQEPAPMMESLSSQTEEEDTAVHSTDTGGRKTRARSDRGKKTTSKNLDDEFDK